MGLMGWFVGLGLGGLSGGILGLRIGGVLQERIESLYSSDEASDALSTFSDRILDRADDAFFDIHERYPTGNEFYEYEYLSLCAKLAQRYGTNDSKARAMPEKHYTDTTNKIELEEALQIIANSPKELERRAYNLATYWESEGVELDVSQWIEIARRVVSGEEIRDILEEYGYNTKYEDEEVDEDYDEESSDDDGEENSSYL